jgi:dipeptidyl aminopeptidase/acylaminoacyl peptidase
VLFGNPERLEPRISPDGARLAWLAPDEGVLNVWVADADAGNARPVTRERARDIRAFRWAGDGRHLLHWQDVGGDENWHLLATDLVGGETRDLTPFDGVQAQVVKIDHRHPDTIVVALNRRDPSLHDAYRLDLRTGELELAAENPGFVGAVADAELRVRAALETTDDGGVRIHVRDDESEPWRVLHEGGLEDALTTAPLAFSRDGATLFAVSSVGADTGRLVRIDCASGSVEPIVEDPAADVVDVHFDPDTLEPQVAVLAKARTAHVVIDPPVAEDVAALTALEPGDLRLVARDAADRRWLVAFDADDGPIRYHLWSRAERRATFLFEHQPALARYRLAPREPFSLAARDGLTLHGYLTFPPGQQRSGLPTVLLVHGGPWARDFWRFDSEAQWLANRGYLCVQVNFRGSTGYGKAFTSAGDREWGARMHDDLVDTARWIADRGHADPQRIGIMGGSYGGYAALVGAAFTPELFRCAVDVVGPSNLITLLESIPPYWMPMRSLFTRRVGDLEADRELLWSRSPLSRADRIRIPILIAQGANDPRVKQAESEQIVAALRERGVPHEYLLFEDEGHGFVRPENRLRFFGAAERFLARHLGGRSA